MKKQHSDKWVALDFKSLGQGSFLPVKTLLFPRRIHLHSLCIFRQSFFFHSNFLNVTIFHMFCVTSSYQT